MGRKRIKLPSVVEAEIATRTARGESAATIAAAVGPGVSSRTVHRRIREMRAQGVPQAKQAGEPLADDVPDEVPEGTDANAVKDWIRRIQIAASKAEAQGNLAAFASLSAKLVTLWEHERKSAPIPKQDPNENPDMIAAKERGRAEFHKLIEKALA